QEPREIIIPSSLGIQDPVLNGLILQYTQLQLDRRNLIQGENIENPYLLSIDQKLNALKLNILENIRTLMASGEILLSDLNSRSKKLESEIQQLPTAEREFVNINR